MKFLLLQPRWEFDGSTYFGCREEHVPLELFYARQQLQLAGHEAVILDAHLERLSAAEAAGRVREVNPDFLVITTAPTYLFWRCPQPELRIPAHWLRELRPQLAHHAVTVAIGPHGSATPATVQRKLGCDVVVQGEPDQVLPRLATGQPLPPGFHQTDMAALPALDWGGYPWELRFHRHHVFHGKGRGAEVEASRGCPWSCNFCNKTLFRNKFRERPVEAVLAEVEDLIRLGFGYIYFIDEIFGCGRQTPKLLEALAALPVQFGIQTRIDLWNEDSLAALGRAGCISLECGIESITPEGRRRFRKGCKLENDRIEQLLRVARRHVPWVQANLIGADDDDPAAILAWRENLIAAGIWASQPVPVFAFPGTPLYSSLFGEPDDQAWERAHEHYLRQNHRRTFSDIQESAPEDLARLEAR